MVPHSTLRIPHLSESLIPEFLSVNSQMVKLFLSKDIFLRLPRELGGTLWKIKDEGLLILETRPRLLFSRVEFS